VLEAGLGEPASNMAGWIAPAVARDTQVCVYDRAGLGWSEPATGAQDGLAVATDLHTLRDRAHVAGPYVLVGHSTGGVYMRVFAAEFPEQVAGMVLLDSTPNDAFTRLPDYPGFYSLFRRAIGLMPSLARVGVMRLSYPRIVDRRRARFSRVKPGDSQCRRCGARHSYALVQWACRETLMTASSRCTARGVAHEN
jgi:pimeloyl-ACP methyl ester carboxylesterase